MIPPFTDDGLLPPGIHSATWEEFTARFGWNDQRRVLLRGMRAAMDALLYAGCNTVYINGSFVTNKEAPRDYDACYDGKGIAGVWLHEAFFDREPGRPRQKSEFAGEWRNVRLVEAATNQSFLDFFQSARDGVPKGIVRIALEDRGAHDTQ